MALNFAISLLTLTGLTCFVLTAPAVKDFFKFISFKIDGSSCTQSVFSFDNVVSDIYCAMICSKTSLCVAFSYNKITNKCVGCNMFDGTDESQEGVIFYGFGGVTGVTNVAYNKQAKQSSVFSGHNAWKGVDGNTNQYFSPAFSCFVTANTTGKYNWWYVDLQYTYILKEVKLFNRLDCCSFRASNVQVLIGSYSIDNMREVAFSAGQIANIWSIPLSGITPARYVKLVHRGHPHFHLCEVQVFAAAGQASTQQPFK